MFYEGTDLIIGLSLLLLLCYVASPGDLPDPGFNQWPVLQWHPTPTPVFLPGEFHRQKSLVGYSPWGRKESDMTERLTLSLYSYSHFNRVN